MTRQFADMTALELASGYATGAFRPSTVIEALDKRIDRLDPPINAIIARDRSALIAAAHASDARWAAGQPLSKLDGVPVTVKDNLHARGLPARWGSHAHADEFPGTDEPAVARLRAAGMLIQGKTNVPEFTLQGYTGNLLFGTTFNPVAPGRTPGGSTGGGAAGVAAGYGPLAIGTDGGGSIRRPAAHCGLWGFKPSIGTVARAGGFPAILHDFEVIGPIARDAADLHAIMSLLTGPDPVDLRSYRALAPLNPLPLAPQVHAFRTIDSNPVDPEIAAAFEACLGRAAALGWRITDGAEPFDATAVATVWKTVAEAGIAWHVSQHLNPSAVGDNARSMAAAGAALSATDYLEALDGVRQIRAQAAELFETVDLVISPTIAALAWAADRPFPDVINGHAVGPRGHAVFTAWANVAGLPAMSFPIAMTRDGGGIGLQVIAGAGRDQALLDFANSTLTILAAAAPVPSRILP